VTQTQPPELTLYRWVEALQCRGLDILVLPLLEILKIWGFVGSQAIWLLTPFVAQHTLIPWADVLESPEVMERVQQRWLEGAVRK